MVAIMFDWGRQLNESSACTSSLWIAIEDDLISMSAINEMKALAVSPFMFRVVNKIVNKGSGIYKATEQSDEETVPVDSIHGLKFVVFNMLEIRYLVVVDEEI